jgi:predicted transcriptional regulator
MEKGVIHRQTARSVRERAQALGRDWKNARGDVAVLEAAGLLHKGRSMPAPWSQMQATVSAGSST